MVIPTLQVYQVFVKLEEAAYSPGVFLVKPTIKDIKSGIFNMPLTDEKHKMLVEAVVNGSYEIALARVFLNN
jgi:hypothetical protein